MKHELELLTRITAPLGQAIPVAKLEPPSGEGERQDEGRLDGESRDAWLAWSRLVDETAVRIDAHGLAESILSRQALQEANQHRRRLGMIGGVAAASVAACLVLGAVLLRDDSGRQTAQSRIDSSTQQAESVDDSQQTLVSPNEEHSDWLDGFDAELVGMENWLDGLDEEGESVAQAHWEADVAQCVEAIEQQDGEVW